MELLEPVLDEYYTLNELSHLFGVSEDWIIMICNERNIKIHYINGNRFLWDVDAAMVHEAFCYFATRSPFPYSGK